MRNIGLGKGSEATDLTKLLTLFLVLAFYYSRIYLSDCEPKFYLLKPDITRALYIIFYFRKN